MLHVLLLSELLERGGWKMQLRVVILQELLKQDFINGLSKVTSGSDVPNCNAHYTKKRLQKVHATTPEMRGSTNPHT